MRVGTSTQKWSVDFGPTPSASPDMTTFALLGIVFTAHLNTWMLHMTLLGYTLSFGRVDSWPPS